MAGVRAIDRGERCVPVSVVLLGLVVLRRVLGFCAALLVLSRAPSRAASTYWPWRRLWRSIWLCGIVEELRLQDRISTVV